MNADDLTDGPPPIDLKDPFKGQGVTWRQHNGRHIPICSMNDDHLRYAMRLVVRRLLRFVTQTYQKHEHTENAKVKIQTDHGIAQILDLHYIAKHIFNSGSAHSFMRMHDGFTVYNALVEEYLCRGYSINELIDFYDVGEANDAASRQTEEAPSSDQSPVQDPLGSQAESSGPPSGS